MRIVVLLLITSGLHLGCAGPTGPRGVPGGSGTDGKDGKTIESVTLCPSVPGNFPEVLFLIDERYYAILDSNQGRRLFEVTPGQYVTTDGRDCHFTITTQGDLVYE